MTTTKDQETIKHFCRPFPQKITFISLKKKGKRYFFLDSFQDKYKKEVSNPIILKSKDFMIDIPLKNSIKMIMFEARYYIIKGD